VIEAGLPSANYPQNDHKQDSSDQAANEHVPLPRTAQNDLTSTRLIGVVIRWKPLCGTFSDHEQLTRKRVFWFAIVSKLNI
jgi:hypothetical protein